MERKFEAIKNNPGISRILVKNVKTGKWEEPTRGKKFLAARYVMGLDGKKRKEKQCFDSMDEARDFRKGLNPRNQRHQQRSPAEVIRTHKGMSLGELIHKWTTDALPHKNISTQIRYRSYLKHFALLWNMPVEDIQATDIDRLITHWKKPEYLAQGHTTRCDYKHEFSVLRGILNYYVERVNRNYRLPFIKDHKKMLKVKEKSKISKDLTVDEFTRFQKALFEVCVEGGCEVIYYLGQMQYAIYGRVQDAAALHFEDFDFKRDKLHIQRKVQWLRAKGYKDQIVDGSKANAGKTLKTIPALAAKVFREWTMKSGVRSGLLFNIDGELITYRQIENRYSQALKRAGLPFKATHILRHAALSEHYDTCKDILATKEVAGQSDLRSTMRYAKARETQLVQTQKQMDEKLSSLLSS